VVNYETTTIVTMVSATIQALTLDPSQFA